MSAKHRAPLRILLVEDLSTDAELIVRELARGALKFETQRVETEERFLAALDEFSPDLILSDFKMPTFDGLRVIRLTRERSPLAPVIIITGSMNEQTAVECMKAGAVDYVLKEQLSRLGPAVIGALERRRLLEDKHRAEAELRKVLRAVEQSPVSIIITDTEGRIEYVNPRFSQTTGYRRLEVYGKNPRMFKSGETPREVYEELWRTIVAGDEWRGELCNRKKNGDLFWERASISSVRDDAGHTTHFVAAAEDITESRRVGQELQETQARFRATFEQAAVGIAHMALDGRWLRVNEKMCDIVGYSHDELIGVPFQDITYPEDLAVDLDSFRRMRVGEIETFAREKRHVTKDGRVVWVNLTVALIRKPTGDPDYFITVVEDISKRKLFQHALIEEERLLSESQRIAHVGSWSWELATGKITWTDETFRIYGVSRDTFDRTEESFLELLHPDDRAAMQAWITACAAGKKPAELEFRAIRPDGEVRYLSGQGALSCDAVGSPVAMVGTVQDITERRTADAERRAIQDQLIQAQKMESVGRLAGGVAHDFNNLLNVIQGYAELMLRSETADPKSQERLGEILKASRRAADLTRQLLAFSRRQVMEPRCIDLSGVVGDMEKMLKRLIGEDVLLDVVRPARLGSVMADPGQVEQVIMNLCVNARDAMPDGGTVTIELAEVSLDGSRSDLSGVPAPGAYVMLAVSDTGCGMSAEVRARIFEPFFTTKELGKGTGLGLSTVYGVVKQSGGYIWVYSEEGKGTTFKVYFPMVKNAAESVSEAGKAAMPVGGTETVLLVEDDAPLLSLMHEVLAARGYSVFVAEAGADALEKFAAYGAAPDLLVTDVIMPGINGPDLARLLMRRYPGLQVLFISGYTDEAISRHGILDPGVRLLQKPFTEAALLRAVREALTP